LDCEEAFYGGAAGGGKSDALLMAALQYADVPDYHALLIRRTLPELALPSAIMARSQEWLQGTGAAWHETRKRWTFPSGATLTFGYCKRELDVYQYQGAEFDFIGFDELTQFSEFQYTYLFSRLRRSAGSKVPGRMRSASNPGGVGHGWVKKRFITKRAADVVFIPAKLRDNPHLDRVSYERNLRKLSPLLAQQLLEGDWGAFEGMAYPSFDHDTHVVDPFDIPASWQRFEAMDHGVTNPTAWLLFTVDYDNNLIVADEHYQPGLPDVHAAEILDRRSQWWEAKDDKGWPVRHSAYGDPASLRESLPLKNAMGQPLSLQEIYQGLGVHLVPGNNRRRTGYVQIAQLLQPDVERVFPLWHPNAGQPGAPRLFFTTRCSNLVQQLQDAPLAGEDDPDRGEAVDKKWESAYGHAHAALRYGVTTRTRPSEEPVQEPDDPRVAQLARMQHRLDTKPEAVEEEPDDWPEQIGYEEV
jgi:hypothetical protein